MYSKEPQKGYRKTTRAIIGNNNRQEILPQSMSNSVPRHHRSEQAFTKRVGLIMSSLTLFHRAAWMGPRWGRCICVLSFYHYTRNLLAIPFFHIPAASSTENILCAA